MIFRRNDTEHTRRQRWRTIASGFAFHQDELDVILYDCIGLVWLSQKTAAVSGRFIDSIRYLVPDDGGQIRKAKNTAMVLD
jgi:hypothetical protein